MDLSTQENKRDVLSVISFIISLIPALAMFVILFQQNKTGPAVFENLFTAIIFKPVYWYIFIAIIIAVIALVRIQKSNTKGLAMAVAAILISIATFGISYNVHTWQQARDDEFQQQQLQHELDYQEKLRNSQ